MTDKMNVDDLLRQELTNLKADAPADVWQNINAKLNVSAQPSPANSASNTATSVAKSAALSIKTIAVAVATIAAIGAITYFVAFAPSKTAPVQQMLNPTPIVTNESIEQPTLSEQNTIGTGEEQVTVSTTTVSKKNKTYQPKSSITTQTTSGENVVNTNTERNQNNQPSQNQLTQQATKPVHENKGIAEMPKSPKHIAENVNKSGNNLEEELTAPKIPNVFTPFHAEGSDGVNDEFVITLENEILFDLKITDAKGNTVFETKDKNQHWNGYNQYTGVECKQGVYVYALRYQVEGMKESRVTTGKLTLQQ